MIDIYFTFNYGKVNFENKIENVEKYNADNLLNEIKKMYLVSRFNSDKIICNHGDNREPNYIEKSRKFKSSYYDGIKFKFMKCNNVIVPSFFIDSKFLNVDNPVEVCNMVINNANEIISFVKDEYYEITKLIVNKF